MRPGGLTVLLFGASGSAGGSVLRASVAAPGVGVVRAFVHDDYQDFSRVADAFANLDACLYCLGISVTQVSGEPEYRRITDDYAMAAAHALRAQSPGAAFHFVSGQGTSLDSPFMWARVKAETERDLIGLVEATCWRPAAIDGVPSYSEPRLYRALRPVFRLMKPIRSLYVSGEDIGRAMLQATSERLRGRIVENAEIRDIAERSRSRA